MRHDILNATAVIAVSLASVARTPTNAERLGGGTATLPPRGNTETAQPALDLQLLDGSEELTVGSEGSRVGALQQAIGSLGCTELIVDADDIFGGGTREGVESVQRAVGFTDVDGRADKNTQAKIVEGITQGVEDCWGLRLEAASSSIPPRTPNPLQAPEARPEQPVSECMQDAASADTDHLQHATEIPPLSADAARYTARSTIYYPEDPSGDPNIEGGMSDRKCENGLVNHTLEDYLEGKSGLQGEGSYVALAMDSNAFPYGTVMRIPELEAQHERPIVFKVVDTGGAFRGKSTGRVYIMVRWADDHAELGSLQELTLVVIRTPS